MTLQFADMTPSSNFFDSGLILFLLSLVTGPNFMSEIPPSEFFLISGDWDELGIPNLV